MANFVSGSGITSYAYRTDGSRSFYGAESAVLYTETQAPGYGYNGEYTHESLGMQYLRARYLNMATGTFLSRDTYGGTMNNILSQNRYTYVRNNPVNYADPDGHKAVGTTIKNIFSAMATTTRKAAQEAKNQTGRAAEIAVARSGNGAAAVSMATNRITRNEVNGVKQGTTQGATAVQSAGEKIVKAPWIESVAAIIEKRQCAAYDYCENVIQTFIEGKDVDRMLSGGKTFLKGAAEAFGGASLVVVGGVEVATGVGIPLGVAKILLGGFGLATAVADVSQGTQDIEYGWNGDSTTPNSNFIRDGLFGGSDKRYEIVSTLVAAVGLFEGFINYPMLAGNSVTALIPGRGTQEGRTALINNDSRAVSRMSKKQLKSNLPEGWTYTEHNGRVHIKDANGNFRIRIDPPDNVTNYPHMHIYDEFGNPLDIDENIVGPKSPDGHIPWNK